MWILYILLLNHQFWDCKRLLNILFRVKSSNIFRLRITFLVFKSTTRIDAKLDLWLNEIVQHLPSRCKTFQSVENRPSVSRPCQAIRLTEKLYQIKCIWKPTVGSLEQEVNFFQIGPQLVLCNFWPSAGAIIHDSGIETSWSALTNAATVKKSFIFPLRRFLLSKNYFFMLKCSKCFALRYFSHSRYFKIVHENSKLTRKNSLDQKHRFYTKKHVLSIISNFMQRYRLENRKIFINISYQKMVIFIKIHGFSGIFSSVVFSQHFALFWRIMTFILRFFVCYEIRILTLGIDLVSISAWSRMVMAPPLINTSTKNVKLRPRNY